MVAALAVTETPPIDPPGDAPAEHRALMARVAEVRDREAFRALFVHFGPRVKAFMLKSGADEALAEDIVQDVMLTVWRKVGLYAPEKGSVGAWIFTIARNARIDRLRRGSSRPYEDIDDLDIAADGDDGEAVTLAAERSERVALALADLPDEQREIIELAYIHDVPQTGIAERLGLPLGTVKSRMRLAYGKLRAALQELQG